MLSEGYSDVPFKEPFPPGRLRWAICYILWYILRERHRLWANVFAYSWISCKIKSNNLQNSILVLGPIIFVLDFSIYKLTALWSRYLCWLKCRYLSLVQVKGQWHAFLVENDMPTVWFSLIYRLKAFFPYDIPNEPSDIIVLYILKERHCLVNGCTYIFLESLVKLKSDNI